MKRSMLLSILIVAVLLLPWLRVSRADNREIVVFDGPRGGWLATVRGDVSLEVLEEREGWKRVRLEGWIAGSAASESTPPALPAVASEEATPAAVEGSAAVAPAPAGAAARGVTVSGVLLPSPADQSDSPGAGLVVLLVGELESLDEEHAQAGQRCRDALAASQREIDARSDDYSRQLNSSDNLREATERSDRARQALRQAEQARREQIDECRRMADQLFQKYAIRRAISDLAGRFEFDEVPNGDFRVMASEIGGKAPRAWVLDCPVTGAGPIVLDPRTDRSVMLPYWGLDRSDGSS